jgi:small subunit ribosomal protein S21
MWLCGTVIPVLTSTKNQLGVLCASAVKKSPPKPGRGSRDPWIWPPLPGRCTLPTASVGRAIPSQTAILAYRHGRSTRVAPAVFSPRETVTVGTMIEVKLNEDDRLDWALKTFKRKVQKSGLLQDLRRKRYYVKPSQARQLKAAAARRRSRSARGRSSG